MLTKPMGWAGWATSKISLTIQTQIYTFDPVNVEYIFIQAKIVVWVEGR